MYAMGQRPQENSCHKLYKHNQGLCGLPLMVSCPGKVVLGDRTRECLSISVVLEATKELRLRALEGHCDVTDQKGPSSDI